MEAHSSGDARRRRRIVQESCDLLAEFEQLAPARNRSRESPTPGPAVADLDSRILTRLVSDRIWKHVLLTIAVFACASFAVQAEFDRQGFSPMPGEPGTLRLSRGLAGVLLLFAGQLSLLIGWMRSESLVDFSGRYRWWKWLSASLAAIGILEIANAQHMLPAMAQAIAEPILGTITAARQTLVVVPAAAIGILVLSRVIPDMGRNRFGQILFTVGILLAAVRTMLVHSATTEPLPAPVSDGILLGSTALLVCSLMLHARFVLYICNDPPVAEPVAKNQTVAAIAPNDDEAEPVSSLPTSPKRETALEAKTVSTGRRKSSTAKTSDKTQSAGKRTSGKAATSEKRQRKSGRAA